MLNKETIYIKGEIAIPCAFGSHKEKISKEEIINFLFEKGYKSFDYSCFWNKEIEMFCWECQVRPLSQEDLLPTYTELYDFSKSVVTQKRNQTLKDLDFDKKIIEKILVHFGISPERYV